jgi:large subunit ribosomal protein L21
MIPVDKLAYSRSYASVLSATLKSPSFGRFLGDDKYESAGDYMSTYAIVKVGGKQHRVLVGEKLLVDLIADKKVGDKLDIADVLMLGGDNIKIGKPLIEGAKVTCTVSNMGDQGEGVKGDKIRVYKKKRRKGYEKTIGHRQKFTELTINEILG